MAAYDDLVAQVQAAVAKVQANAAAKDQLDAEVAAHANTKAQLDAANVQLGELETKLMALVQQLQTVTA
jgi:hypothetical protein